ncbi:MAG TPA: TIGR04255 family protein [Stellaceae bacterium]|nr:TIGR04255 family protein [Stellaceae bacterium]
MPERYRHPPLVELIAELRWGSPFPGGQSQGAVFMAATGSHEEFFMRFGLKAGLLGYERAERLLPPGFAAMPFQAIYRFRKKTPEEGTSLYHIGTGVFSANITPPYDSWQQFKPIVENGVGVLLETRIPAEKTMPFTSASLRYLNAFGSKFMEGQSVASFVKNVLGLRVELPTSVQNEVSPNNEARASFQLNMPLKSGQQMTLSVGEGLVAGEQAAVMDLTVGTRTITPPTQSDVMAVLDTANEVAHRVFINVTKGLSEKMEPIKGDQT